MSERHNGNRRLDSWKEIAAHLGRNERTAIRWEKKGLPIHRVPGGKRQAVFAYIQEIDAWLLGQDGKATVSNSPVEGMAGPKQILVDVAHATRSANKTHTYSKWSFVIVAACVLTLLVLAETFFVHSHISASVPPFRFTQLTEDGKYKSTFRTDGTMIYINEVEGSRDILVAKPIAGGPIRKIPTPFANVLLEDISRDGRTLLVTSFQGMESEKPLWTIAVDGGSTHRVGDVLCEWARWSPDNRKIACASGTSIIILHSDGSEAHAVASFQSVPSRLLWSPGGQELRFLLRDGSNSFSSWQLTFGKENGNGQETTTLSKLQDGKGVCSDWAWTEKGDRFACLRLDPEGKSSLLVQPADVALSNWPALDAELPVKLQTIVGVARGKSDNSLFVMVENSYRGELLKVDPKSKTFETYLEGLSAYYLSFSREGQWMTYVNSVDQSLWRSRVDRTEALQLTKGMEVEVSSWSPNSEQIAFMGKQPGQPWRIYLIGRDGGKPIEAASGNDNQGGPSWSPDGKELVYANVDCSQTQTCWVRRLELATRKTEPLPDSHGLRTARWSPDGRYIAAMQPEAQDLLLFDIHTRRWTKLAGPINGDNIDWSSDSQSIFVDNPHGEHPTVECVRVVDGHRTIVASLTSLQNMFGTMGSWVGFDP